MTNRPSDRDDILVANTEGGDPCTQEEIAAIKSWANWNQSTGPDKRRLKQVRDEAMAAYLACRRLNPEAP